jgi:hypothetical protein
MDNIFNLNGRAQKKIFFKGKKKAKKAGGEHLSKWAEMRNSIRFAVELNLTYIIYGSSISIRMLITW